jgi:hypothetical protein
MVRLYNEWEAGGGVRRGLNWCKQNYIHSRAMCKAFDVREQVHRHIDMRVPPSMHANHSR